MNASLRSVSMSKIINHEDPYFQEVWNTNTKRRRANRWNGGYFYSQEICKNIIPNVKTDRNWVTINVGRAFDHSIFFVHNNLTLDAYDFLSDYQDVILVCGVESTTDKLKHLGKTIFLPLSVDVKEIEKYKGQKSKDVAYVGRRRKLREVNGVRLPKGIDYICNLPREEFFKKLSEYKYVYAVGRTAIEAKILECEVLPFDPRFPDPDIWKVLDNRVAAKQLQVKLDEIDGGRE